MIDDESIISYVLYDNNCVKKHEDKGLNCYYIQEENENEKSIVERGDSIQIFLYLNYIIIKKYKMM